ncbi:MAG TPA: hypothetical protein VHC98_04205 [Candidatus Saccharimonadales bacterium]|nr:hypothetical protein [Candidatus Saccharimonadales bacterium]
MYQMGHRRARHSWLLGAAAVLGLGVLAGGYLWLHTVLQAHTALHQSKPVTRTVAAATIPLQHLTEPAFTIDLPDGWHAADNPHTPYTMYSWQGSGNDATRRVDIYLDNLPTGLAVNRLLPVEADGDHLSIIGDVSDNCVNFTQKAVQGQASVVAKWEGVTFNCDTGNYERDVVGIGSAEGGSGISLTGATTGTHHLLITYTDNSANPDYTIFTAIVQRFRLR